MNRSTTLAMRCKNVFLLGVAFVVGVNVLGTKSVWAGDGPDWLTEAENLPRGVVSNDAVTLSNDSTPFHLSFQASRALKAGKIDLALELIKKSLEMESDDADAHMIYATALEKKLATQESEDPALYNKCVREWLYVLRNEYGEEKGDHFRGIGLPGFNGRFYEDEERHRPARNHLIKLTGTCPKPWETNEKFLQKVCRSGETSVKGKLISEKDSAKSGSKKSSSIPDRQPH